MKKEIKPDKELLFEKMVKLNPDFKPRTEEEEKAILAEEEKWIQKAVNPKHKGYCTPMTKPTCTPRRKALAKRFKKGIENNESLLKTIEEVLTELYGKKKPEKKDDSKKQVV